MTAEPKRNDLELLSVVIPARDEESCIASTVENLHVELRLHHVPHEIVVVADALWVDVVRREQQAAVLDPPAAEDARPTPDANDQVSGWGLVNVLGDFAFTADANRQDRDQRHDQKMLGRKHELAIEVRSSEQPDPDCAGSDAEREDEPRAG